MKQLTSKMGDAVPITDQGEFPSLQGPSRAVVGTKADGSTSYARHAKNLPGNESTLKIATKKPEKRPVIGASSVNQHVKAVPTTRQVDVFVSRLDPHTHVNSLLDWVQEMKSDVKVVDVECNRLKSKYESVYSSFHVYITADSADMYHAIELFMAADSWPQGVFVKRFFKSKNGIQQT